jgi:hypothetical protein
MTTTTADGFDWPAIRPMVEAPAYFRRMGIDPEEMERRKRIAASLAGEAAARTVPRRGANHIRKTHVRRSLTMAADDSAELQ